MAPPGTGTAVRSGLREVLSEPALGPGDGSRAPLPLGPAPTKARLKGRGVRLSLRYAFPPVGAALGRGTGLARRGPAAQGRSQSRIWRRRPARLSGTADVPGEASGREGGQSGSATFATYDIEHAVGESSCPRGLHCHLRGRVRSVRFGGPGSIHGEFSGGRSELCAVVVRYESGSGGTPVPVGGNAPVRSAATASLRPPFCCPRGISRRKRSGTSP